MQIFSQDLIYVNLNFKNKEEVLKFLTKEMLKAKIISQEENFYQKIAGSKGLGEEIVFPHFKSELINKFKIIICKLNNPLDFDSLDKNPIKYIFIAAIPIKKNLDPFYYIRVLSAISGNWHNLKNKLKETNTNQEIYEIMKSYNTSDFLFEIGVEEIPASYIQPAMKQIEDFFKEELKKKKIYFNKMRTFSTPRRFALEIIGLKKKQEDEILEKIGPSHKVSYDEKGNLSKAAIGFLKSLNAEKEDIFIKETEKGKYLSLKKEVKGKFTLEILKDLIEEVFSKISFPKSMWWKEKNFYFARPVRSILALYDNELMDLKIKGIKNSKVVSGNIFANLNNCAKVDKIENYEKILEDIFVIADREKRKNIIVSQIKKLTENEKICLDENLLEIVCNLVEYPTSVLAEFAEEYLILPPEVIKSTLSKNQRYFTLSKQDNSLSNQFIFVSNGDPKCSEIIKLGNQKVVKARLEDAKFYYDEDTKEDLALSFPKLQEITFQEKLGSIYDKIQRMLQICDFLTKYFNFEEDFEKDLKLSCKLCKIDLTSQMIGEKEFSSLQGYMGMYYAKKFAYKHRVSKAIYKHYFPKGKDDALPDDFLSQILAIVDKIDTICAIIGIGLLPTGSSDPYAIRRAANGIVRICAEKNIEIDLNVLLEKVFEILNDKVDFSKINDIKEYFKQRFSYYLNQNQFSYDIIEALLSLDNLDICDIQKRAKVLTEYKNKEDFKNLILSFKRTANIIEKEKEFSLDKNLLKEKQEICLYEKYLLLKEKILSLLKKQSYEEILKKLTEFGKYINEFFDNIVVNVEQEEIKNNRIALLQEIKKLFVKVANLEKLIIEN